MTFDSLGLAPEYLRAVADQGYTEPTPVQHEAIPLILSGRDVLAAAQTGTGKTAAFILPMLQRLVENGDRSRLDASMRSTAASSRVRALVLTPTRELALQVEQNARAYGRHRPVRSVAIYGGVSFRPQVAALRKGTPIVVATPGRLLDHVSQHTIDLSRVEILVLDEADRMLDMGFIRDIRRVLALLPPRRQTLMFSATFSDDVRDLAAGLLINPATVDIGLRNAATELVEQSVIRVDRERKRDLLAHLASSGRLAQALVFTRTKHGANRLAEQLTHAGIAAAAIHGNKSQGQRTRALADFKAGRVDFLVATDIAARGIDIEALPHVVNYELPMAPQDYVHRIGRTGRAGVGGRAISLVSVDETDLLRGVERLLRRPLSTEVVPGFEPDRSIRSESLGVGSGDPDRRQGDARHRHAAARREGRPHRGSYAAERRVNAERSMATSNHDRKIGRDANNVRGSTSPRRGAPWASPSDRRSGDRSRPRRSALTGSEKRRRSPARQPVALPGEHLRAATVPTHFGEHVAGTTPKGNK